MEITKLKELLFAKAIKEGFLDCEIYYIKSKSLQVGVFKGEISQYINSDILGISFRGTVNGKMGYAYSEKLSDDVIDLLIHEAKENAEVIEEAGEFINDGDHHFVSAHPFAKTLMTCSAKKQIELALKLEQAGYEGDSRIVSIDHCAVAKAVGEVYIANSYGMELKSETAYSLAYIVARAEENGQTKLGSELWLGHNLEDLNINKLSQRAVLKATNYLGALQVSGSTSPILLKNDVAIDFFGCFVSMFSGEEVQKGFSLLKGKLGEKIASSLVTLKDVKSHEKAIEKVEFDSEGTFVQDKTVIGNGVLKTYLHNMKSAKKDGVPSTGNGFKPSFSSPVGISCANLYMAPGPAAYEALIKELDEGYIITELSGLHSGVNRISLDFSLLAEGFYVSGGEIKYAVEQITIAGNFLDFLKNIMAVGSDLRFDAPGAGGSIGMPSLLVKDIRITGV